MGGNEVIFRIGGDFPPFVGDCVQFIGPVSQFDGDSQLDVSDFDWYRYY